MAPEPPKPDQTPKYSLTGGGGYNPQIQGDTRVYGEGLINMGSFCGGGGMGLLVLILGLFGIVWAYFYLVRKGARFRFSWNPSGEPPEPPQPTQTTEYSQTRGGGHNPQVQRINGGGHSNLETAVGGGGGMGLPRRGMGLPRILILGLFGSVCAYFYIAVRTECLKLDVQFSWNPFGGPPEPPQPTL